MKFPLMTKIGAVAGVACMVMAVLGQIDGLVSERASRGQEAIRSVEQSHAAAQTLVGPLLARSCVEQWVIVTGTGADRKEELGRHAYTLVEAPAKLAMTGTTTANALYRGLFKVNAYAGQLAATAQFNDFAALQPTATQKNSQTTCDQPVLLLAVTDVRGVRTAAVSVDGHDAPVHPGTSVTRFPRGLSASLPAARIDAPTAAPLVAKVSLDLLGTSELAWVPAASDVQWTLNSDWPSPSFGGQFVPDRHDVHDKGFQATWHLSALATTAPADVAAGGTLCGGGNLAGGEATEAKTSCLDTMSVAFIDPVNPYVLSDRAVKYSALFIVLTFIAVGLIEVLSGRRVHPVQYLLVGLALSVFFLLLLSLSEHLAFEWAYMAASSACASLLGFYATSMLGRRLSGLAFGAGIASLYGLLYLLLQMEQNALVIGSLVFFAALALVMTLTRGIDWYALFARLSNPVETPPPTPRPAPVGGAVMPTASTAAGTPAP